jgi:hypothetical protein
MLGSRLATEASNWVGQRRRRGLVVDRDDGVGGTVQQGGGGTIGAMGDRRPVD